MTIKWQETKAGEVVRWTLRADDTSDDVVGEIIANDPEAVRPFDADAHPHCVTFHTVRRMDLNRSVFVFEGDE